MGVLILMSKPTFCNAPKMLAARLAKWVGNTKAMISASAANAAIKVQRNSRNAAKMVVSFAHPYLPLGQFGTGGPSGSRDFGQALKRKCRTSPSLTV